MHSVLTPGQAGYELCLHDVCPYSRWSLRASVRAVFEVKVSVRRKNAPHTKNMAKAVAIRLVLCIPRSAPMTYSCLVLSLHVFWKNIFTNSSTSCGLLRLMFQSWNQFTQGTLCFFFLHNIISSSTLCMIGIWGLVIPVVGKDGKKLQNVKPPTLTISISNLLLDIMGFFPPWSVKP